MRVESAQAHLLGRHSRRLLGAFVLCLLLTGLAWASSGPPSATDPAASGGNQRTEPEAAGAAPEEAPESEVDTAPIDVDGSIETAEVTRGWHVTGDARGGLFGEQETFADEDDETDGRLEARIRVEADLNIRNGVRLRTRLASNCSTEACDPSFVLDWESTTSDGLADGEVTLDELFFHWFQRDRFDVAFGRLQTKFVARGGVFAKSLDRNDSHNTSVNWTDGLHATHRAGKGWTAHLVLQYNPPGGPSSIRRAPLDFSESGSRVTSFVSLQNTRNVGPIRQRTLDISYLPDSLQKDGTPEGRIEDYVGVVGRFAARWPYDDPDVLSFRAAGELGWAPETPTNAAMDLEGEGDTGGLAFTLAMSVMNLRPRHSIGLNYGYVEAGWLLSPQYRENSELWEIRYQWRIRDDALFTVRIRQREEIERRTVENAKLKDRDFFIRVTWPFDITKR